VFVNALSTGSGRLLAIFWRSLFMAVRRGSSELLLELGFIAPTNRGRDDAMGALERLGEADVEGLLSSILEGT
jgi:hypothetical protein